MASIAMRTAADLADVYGGPGLSVGVVAAILISKTIDVTDLTKMGEVIFGYTLLGVALLYTVGRYLATQWDRKYGPQDPAPVKAASPEHPPQ